MTLQPGQTLLHYEIVDKLGEGGMGVVWRARDTDLGREVAIKVLPELLGGDPERLARFEREAKLLASLSHPNIAEIHGLHADGERRFIAMELIAGEDLAARIDRGPMSESEVLEIAKQVARALEAAHEQGVIHRDLKPANIQLLPDGRVKVLDFGLAKALLPEGDAAELRPSMSPTLTSLGTQAGVLLGTAAYMAPEQARGQAADKRADIWALGCVLFEALTGQAAFPGDTISDTLAGVLKSEPDWQALPESTHPTLRLLIGRCLEKDVRQRIRDVGEARIAVEAILGGSSAGSAAVGATLAGVAADTQEPSERTSGPGWAVAAALAGLAAAVAGIGAWSLRPTPEAPTPVVRRFEIPVADLQVSNNRAPRLSPDGRRIVYVADDRIWVRHLDEVEASAIPGSEGGRAPAWSPEGDELAWRREGEIWRARLNGTSPDRVCETSSLISWISWGPGDQLVLTPDDGPLWEVSARGGDPISLLEPDPEQEVDYHQASHLPGGRGLIFSQHRMGRTQADTIQVLVDSERKTVLQLDESGLVHPVVSDDGYLVYRRLGTNAGIWAAPFSLERLEITGDAVLIDAAGDFVSVASDGSLLYYRGTTSADRQLVWVDREGRVTGTIGEPRATLSWPSLSPDGKSVAVMAVNNEVDDVWAYDTETGSPMRLTFESDDNWAPAWFPDGDRLVVGRHYGARAQLFTVTTDGSGRTVELTGGNLADVSPSGLVIFELPQEGTQDDLYFVPGDGSGEPRIFLGTPEGEEHTQLSPGGDFVAYQSSDSGRDEMYLKRFPSGEGRWQVSTEGGDWARWSATSGELFFLRDDRLMAVEVDLEGTPRIGRPRELFSLRQRGLYMGPRPYDVTADGQRFVMMQPLVTERLPALTYVENWAAALE